MKKCINCKREIPFVEFYKQHIKRSYVYTCPECGAVQKATVPSRIINSLLYFAILMYLFYTRAFSLPIKILLILLYISLGEPFLFYLLRYKKANSLTKK